MDSGVKAALIHNDAALFHSLFKFALADLAFAVPADTAMKDLAL